MKVKTKELTDCALDWAVADADGNDMEYFQVVDAFAPSEYWDQGGPIIEREGIDLICTLVGNPKHKDPSWQRSTWAAQYRRMGYGSDRFYGTTPLIAAMRCYVASKLGDEVEIPDELL
jgi:hypothetical protein